MKKLDKHISLLIIAWIRKNLEGCSNPYQHGKSLQANRSGQWRYRIGEYRLITEIMEDKVVILMLNVGTPQKYLQVIQRLTKTN
ncbi:MAG: type II toxin-antitoxin system RelE/ParE family toxin [Sphaerochaetaceae bacterium]|nr:type II toxin-antitoxin system RelE/ParE family toxin [Sphaerochaetaceae bacterium]MDD4218584.1 type II toxin-antitoxin system RelE/ParE family toxin [Sphaerochaetaceae bacterium]